MEQLRHNKRLGAGLASVTAAVVGVVLSLALWFAINTLFIGVKDEWRFGPVTVPRFDLQSFDLGAACLALLAAYLIFRLKWGIFRVVLACMVGGILVWLLRFAIGFNPD